MSFIKDLLRLVKQENKRQKYSISLIASENFAYKEVLSLSSSLLTNKYAEGYPGKRYYSGCKYIDEIETLAINEAKTLFNCNFANVQPLSGSIANQCIYSALLQPGDIILSLKLAHGGHLTHNSPHSFVGKIYKCITYEIDPKTHTINYEELRKLALEHKPKLIIAGASSYPRNIDFEEFSKIAKESGSYLMGDISHISGLIVADYHPHCFPWCDVVMTTTHKQLRGPRAAIILWNDPDLTHLFNKAVFPGTQGGPKMDQIAGIAIALNKCKRAPFKKYIKQTLSNCATLCSTLKELGCKIISDGTDTSMFLLDTKETFGITGDSAQYYLEQSGIYVNKNMIFKDDSPSTPSGIRLGTLSITSQGLKEAECKLIAHMIYDIIQSKGKTEKHKEYQEAIKSMVKNPK